MGELYPDPLREAFADAFDELCRQHPLPPLPYPNNPQKLKRLKSIMRKQRNRKTWSNKLRAHRKWLPTNLDYYELALWEGVISKIATDSVVPEGALFSTYALLFQ
jgi:hypothetical protein